jgi:hypothetical protein
MSGRRSHLRFTINPALDGLLRVLNDVIVQPSERDGLIAISREPGVVGETLFVQILDRQGTLNKSMRIAESRPLVSDGAVRHWLRLERVEPVQPGIVSGTASTEPQTTTRK